MSAEPSILHVVCQMPCKGAKHTCQMIRQLVGTSSNVSHDGSEGEYLFMNILKSAQAHGPRDVVIYRPPQSVRTSWEETQSYVQPSWWGPWSTFWIAYGASYFPSTVNTAVNIASQSICHSGGALENPHNSPPLNVPVSQSLVTPPIYIFTYPTALQHSSWTFQPLKMRPVCCHKLSDPNTPTHVPYHRRMNTSTTPLQNLTTHRSPCCLWVSSLIQLLYCMITLPRMMQQKCQAIKLVL